MTRPLAVAILVLLTALAPPACLATDAVETSGDVLRAAIPLAALAVAWHRDDDAGVKQFLWAYGATVGSTLVLKQTIHERRPDGSGNDAFPSGHAATAFAGAAVLQRRYGWRTAWPAWVLAGWTGWTRVDADKHDWGDVTAGAAIGVASAWLIVEPMEGVRVQPAALQDGGVGVVFSARW